MTTPDEAQALLPVTQADRDAAGQVDPANRVDYKLGHMDGSSTVQAFARHRISHSLPGDVGMLVDKLRDRAAKIPGEIAERENEAQSHCGSYGTDTAEDYMDDEDVLLMHDAADRLAALTPSALSGDAGEVERLRAEVGEARREGAAMWRCGVSDTIILVDRVRRIFDRERGLKRNRALANLDAELEIALQDWFTHSRAARPNSYSEADAAFKDFSAKSHLPAARKDTP